MKAPFIKVTKVVKEEESVLTINVNRIVSYKEKGEATLIHLENQHFAVKETVTEIDAAIAELFA